MYLVWLWLSLLFALHYTSSLFDYSSCLLPNSFLSDIIIMMGKFPPYIIFLKMFLNTLSTAHTYMTVHGEEYYYPDPDLRFFYYLVYFASQKCQCRHLLCNPSIQQSEVVRYHHATPRYVGIIITIVTIPITVATIVCIFGWDNGIVEEGVERRCTFKQDHHHRYHNIVIIMICRCRGSCSTSPSLHYTYLEHVTVSIRNFVWQSVTKCNKSWKMNLHTFLHYNEWCMFSYKYLLKYFFRIKLFWSYTRI